MKSSTKSPGKKKPPSNRTAKGDYSPQEARSRFERAVDIAIATKPLHKPAKVISSK
jgi:hypothetical protein